MTYYDPVNVVLYLVRTYFPVGRSNSPCKSKKKPDFTTKWEESEEKPLPSIEFKYYSQQSQIKSLSTAFRYNLEMVRIVVRSAREDECWKIKNAIIDDILIPRCKSFVTDLSTKFSSMEYNFIEYTDDHRMEQYSENELFYRSDILVTLHRPKVYTLN